MPGIGAETFTFRDQELRFTVHESPDYQRLKVSVFNDDKKTDLIGETWIDLSKLIIPGGGQSDQWHSLQFKGKYAGEVRIEMTYYDSRPEDEAVIEKRREKAQAKNSSTGSGSSLSGPRQPRQMKRRPLPEDPTGGASRAAAHEAPAANAHPPANSRQESVDQMKAASRHAEPSASSSHPSRHHEPPREYPRGRSKHSYPDPRSGYPDEHGGSYNRLYQEPHSHNRDYYEHHHEHHRHRSTRDTYDYPPEHEGYYRQNPPPDHFMEPVDHGRYHEEPVHYSHHVRHPPHVKPNGYAAPPNHVQVPAEQDTVPYPRQEMVMQGPPRQLSEHEQPAYAAMQPTVEDEPDDGPPPPPPVHRSSASDISRPSMGQPSYRPPPQEYIPMPDPRNYHATMPAADMAQAQPGTIPAPVNPSVHMSQYHPHPVPQHAVDSHGYNASMPPVETSAAQPVTMPPPPTNQSVHMGQYHPTHSMAQNSGGYPAPADPQTPERHSGRVAQGPPPNNALYEQRMESSPSGVDEREIRQVPSSISPSQFSVRRKSVGGQPSAADDQAINSPFSPDSYDVLNPRASPSAARDAPPHDRFGRDARLTPPNEDHHSRDDGPIIGDDGREIDPSDHLPSETWAPEPERKTKKPEVKIRFKHMPQNGRPSMPQAQPPTPDSAGRARQRVHFRPQTYTPPRDDMYNHMPPRYSPPAYSPSNQQPPPSQQQQQQRSTSPTPSSRRRSLSPGVSSLYSLDHVGPPIPAKVPIQAPNSGPMDALSQELQSIDLGSSRRGGQGYTR